MQKVFATTIDHGLKLGLELRWRTWRRETQVAAEGGARGEMWWG